MYYIMFNGELCNIYCQNRLLFSVRLKRREIGEMKSKDILTLTECKNLSDFTLFKQTSYSMKAFKLRQNFVFLNFVYNLNLTNMIYKKQAKTTKGLTILMLNHVTVSISTWKRDRHCKSSCMQNHHHA